MTESSGGDPAAPRPPSRVFRVEGFEFDPADGALRRGDSTQMLTPRTASTLLSLLTRNGALVDKDTLMREVWPDLAVEENNLNQQISRLRRLLGMGPDGRDLIETVPRRGYRLTARVESLESAARREAEIATVVAAPAVAANVVQLADPASTGADPRPSSSAVPAMRRALLMGGAALLVALAAWGIWSLRSLRAPDVRTLAVLPFQNLTGDAANDYLSEGITDEVTTALARVSPDRLRVIARTSAARFRSSSDAVRAMGRQLGADLVLEGSLRRVGTRLRVAARLSDPATETQIWAQSYDYEVGDPLAVETELARTVASTIRVGAGSPRDTPEFSAVPAEARDVYRRARYFHALASVPSIEQAIEAYSRAVQIEPNFGLAYAGLSRAWIFSTATRPVVALDRAREAAHEALRFAPDLPEAQLAHAMATLYVSRNLREAEREFRRAVAMDPGNADAHFYYAQMLTAAGRFDEALEAAGRAQALDPFSPLVHHYVARIYVFARRPQQAIEQLRGTLELQPNYAWARLFLAVAHEQTGNLDRALLERQRYWSLMGVPTDRTAALGDIFAKEGYDGVRRAWVQWIEGFEKQRGFVTSTELGLLHAALGDHQRALAALRRAVDDNVRDLIYLNVYPELDPLRGTPEFRELLARVFP